jgi:hypothetical protein
MDIRRDAACKYCEVVERGLSENRRKAITRDAMSKVQYPWGFQELAGI